MGWTHKNHSRAREARQYRERRKKASQDGRRAEGLVLKAFEEKGVSFPPWYCGIAHSTKWQDMFHGFDIVVKVDVGVGLPAQAFLDIKLSEHGMKTVKNRDGVIKVVISTYDPPGIIRGKVLQAAGQARDWLIGQRQKWLTPLHIDLGLGTI